MFERYILDSFRFWPGCTLQCLNPQWALGSSQQADKKRMSDWQAANGDDIACLIQYNTSQPISETLSDSYL